MLSAGPSSRHAGNMPYVSAKRETSSVLASHKESSAQASSAARIRRVARPGLGPGLALALGLETTRGPDEDAAHRQRIQELRYGLPFLDPDAGIPRSREPGELRDASLQPLDDWLRQRAADVAAKPEELQLAQDRADAVIAALTRIYPGLDPAGDIYRTGSIAHGDALSPLNDVDLGVILRNRPDLGPDQDQSRDRLKQEMRQTAVRLRQELEPQFPELKADADNKRSIVLEFTPGQDDFTCDVILAMPGTGGNLLIPNTELRSGWDENDPLGHVRRLRQAEATSGGSFSQTVRLVKHWRNGQLAKPLYSWNIKTLALEAGDNPAQPFEGLYRFFAHSLHSVADGPTENPGSANFPPPTVATDRLEVTRLLLETLATLDRARMFALAGESERALTEVKRIFPDG